MSKAILFGIVAALLFRLAPAAMADAHDERRYDEAVLRWLPEMRVVSKRYGVPVALLAGVVRVMSDGEPGVVRFDGRRGLAGVREDALRASGIAEWDWYEPATNLRAAAGQLSRLRDIGRPWSQVLEEYAGGACDSLGQCAEDYAFAILAWQDAYSSMLSDADTAGIDVLPDGWKAPEATPCLQSAPERLTLPDGVAWPTVDAAVTADAEDAAGIS